MPKKNNPGCNCCDCLCEACDNGVAACEINVEISSGVSDNSCVSCADFVGTYTLGPVTTVTDGGGNFLYCLWQGTFTKCGELFTFHLRAQNSGANTTWIFIVFDAAFNTEALFNFTTSSGKADCLAPTEVLNFATGDETHCLWASATATLSAS